jgi:pimeloyl-ACP methyl ester carboxylesterase
MKTFAARAVSSIGFCLVALGPAVVLGSQPARTTQLPTGISMSWSETGGTDGPAVLFLHGFTDTRRSFAGLVAELTQLRPDLRLITVDLRGHGSSTLPFAPGCRARPELCFTVAHHAADVLALMDQLGIVRADLVGHSLGTLVAQTVALDAPARVRRLVLIGGAASTSANPLVQYLRRELVEGEWSSRLRALGYSSPDRVYELPVRTVGLEAEAWIRSNWAVEAGVDSALLATIADEALNLPFGTWVGTLRALETTDLRGRLGQLAAPTLVIWGVQDQNFPEEPDQVALRQALAASGSPSAWWKRYGVRSMPADGVTDDHGHNLHWAAPAVVARDLAAFFRDGGAPTTDRARVAADSRVVVESQAAAVLQLTH